MTTKEHEWILQLNYGQGWEDEYAADNLKETASIARDYSLNCPQFSRRIIRRRVKNESAEKPTIYQLALAAGVVCQHHESDLYLPVNDATRALVEAYEFRESVRTFRDNRTGKPMYDVPFAFDPWWEGSARPGAVRGQIARQPEGGRP